MDPSWDCQTAFLNHPEVCQQRHPLQPRESAPRWHLCDQKRSRPTSAQVMKGSRQRILLGNAALFFLGIHGLTIKNRLCNHEKYENGEVFSLEVSIPKSYGHLLVDLP